MPVITKLGKKSQIVIPKKIREALHIGEGSELIIDVMAETIILKQKPANYTKELRGLHKKIWEATDPLEYVRKERDSW